MKNVFRILSGVSIVMSLAVGAIIFLLDVRVPLGLSIEALYVIPLLISLLADKRKVTMRLAIFITILIGLGLVLSPGAGVPRWIVAWDRLITVLMVWITAVLGWEMASAKQQIRNMEKLLVMCAWTKQVRVEGQWIPVEEYLTRHCGVKLSHGISREAAERVLRDEGLEIGDRS